MLEAETIVRDVVQRRRRIMGPSHPKTLHAEEMLSHVRECIGRSWCVVS